MRLRSRTLILVAASIAAVAICIPLDRHLYPILLYRDALQHDWYQVFRQAGNLLTWVLVAAVLATADVARLRRQRQPLLRPLAPGQGPAAIHRAGLLLLSTALAGGVAEVVKLAAGRSRPVPPPDLRPPALPPVLAEAPTGAAPWLGPLADDAVLGLGFPSSHAAVAFAGATALGLLIPGTLPALVPVAAVCAATRLFAGAHSASDVLAGGVIGILTALAFHHIAHRRSASSGAAPRP